MQHTFVSLSGSKTNKLRRTLTLAALGLLMLPSLAQAWSWPKPPKIVEKIVEEVKETASLIPQYYRWRMVELPLSTGAACGDGSPYRFFVNQTLDDDMQVFLEPGGACWTEEGCSGKGDNAATHPDGIKATHMVMDTFGIAARVSPLTSRLHPAQLKVNEWNTVYLPYCTGDAHLGSKISTYTSPDGTKSRVQHHMGYQNVKAATDWVKANLPRPDELLVSGQSAGSIGATGNYSYIRKTLNPNKSSLLADSGPIPWGPFLNGKLEDFPSVGFYRTANAAWGLRSATSGIIANEFVGLPGFRSNNYATIYQALASAYPNDRFGFMSFQQDEVIPRYLYNSFHPDIIAAPTDGQKQTLAIAKFQRELELLRETALASSHTNLGYWMPYWRNVPGVHVLTMLELNGTGIEEMSNEKYNSAKYFIENVLDHQNGGQVPRVYETDHYSDRSRSSFTQWMIESVTDFLRLLGVAI